MGLYDRPYWRDDAGYPSGGGGGIMRGMGIGMPKPGKVVKWLLIINGGMFLLQLIFDLGMSVSLSKIFGVTVKDFWQVWRYMTFQFLHSTGDIWHIAFNMLGLYMLGTPLEQLWGPKRFLRFYLSCGAVAGVLYVIAGLVLHSPGWIPLIGASGGVYGVLLAAAVLFPHFKIIFLFFPVPIRLAALVIFGGMILFLLSSLKAGVLSGPFWSDVAHFGGAGMAALWLWVIPRFGPMADRAVSKANRGMWERKMRQKRNVQAEIDRILDKIRVEGINSLSWKEKRALKEATKKQQREDQDISRL